MKKIKLVIGKKYGYFEPSNTFELLGLYGKYAWVVWGKGSDEEEVDMLYLDTKTLKGIIKANETK